MSVNLTAEQAETIAKLSAGSNDVCIERLTDLDYVRTVQVWIGSTVHIVGTSGNVRTYA